MAFPPIQTIYTDQKIDTKLLILCHRIKTTPTHPLGKPNPLVFYQWNLPTAPKTAGKVSFFGPDYIKINRGGFQTGVA